MKITNLILLLTLLTTLLVANPATPKQTIRGRVMDKSMRVSLPGVNVILLGSNPLVGTVTDEKGYFRIENVEIGRISLKFSYIGYHDVTLSNLNLQTGKELYLNVGMEESAIQGEEVVIVAKADKTGSVNKMAVVSARSFTVEETERYAGSRADVARMASNYAGVLGVDDSRNDIIIRGNSPMGLLWRLEGVDIPSPNHWGMSGTTGGPVCMLNNTLLENSDFITGAFPSEYGNATSGVFDLHMRSGNNEKFEFLAQIGFNGFELGAEGPISKRKQSSFLINYRYSTLGVFSKLGMDFGTMGVPFYQDLSFKLNFPDTKMGNISLFGLGGISTIKIWESERDTTEEAINFYGGEGIDITSGTDMGVVGLTQVYHFSPTLYSKLTLSASSQISMTDVDTLTPVTLAKTTVYGSRYVDNRISGSYTLNKRFNSKNTTKIGLIYKQIIGDLKDSILLNDNTFRPQYDFDGSTALLQAFAHHQYRPSDKISMGFGVHYQQFMHNNSFSIEPRLGVKYRLNELHSFTLGYGLHSQISPLFSYFYMAKLDDGTLVKTNPELGLTKSHHFIGGYDFKINEFTRAKVDTYYQRIFDAPIDAHESNAYSTLNDGASFVLQTPEYLANRGKGKNYGIELTIERFLNNGFYFLATGSLFDSKYTGSDNIEHNTAFNSNYVVNGLIGKEFVFSGNKSRKTLSIDIKTTYAGGKRTTPYDLTLNTTTGFYERNWDETKAFSIKLTDYTKTDLKISYKISGSRVSQEWALEFTNLLNNKNIQSDQFNKLTGKTNYVYQTTFMVIPQWRILF
ncbi:MAG: TonB-dependent receptor [Salinivirgaceae bacterium]|nr:TonB-dependent receptor [Salinivirgaceae bacterium]